MTKDYAIGQSGQLIHSDPKDMKRFRELTTDQVVIMGRKTYDSLPNGTLPNRVNYVISNTLEGNSSTTVFSNLELAIISAQTEYPDKEIFIIGGESIYHQALEQNLVDRAYITTYDCLAPEADTYFPFHLIEDGSITKVNTDVIYITPTCAISMEFFVWDKPIWRLK